MACNARVYAVDANALFARPGPRIVDSLELLAGILHREEFREFAVPGSELQAALELDREIKGAG